MPNCSYHFYPSPITHESRILKEAETLRKHGLVEKMYVLGTARIDLPEVEHLLNGFLEIRRYPNEIDRRRPRNLRNLLGMRRWLTAISDFLRRGAKPGDVLHCHHLVALKLGCKLKHHLKCHLLYDAHELESERANMGRLLKVASRLIEKRTISCADQMWVVSNSIAAWYAENMKAKPTVICNYPMLTQAETRGDSLNVEGFRTHFNIDEQAIVFLYQGSMAKGRGVYLLIEAFRQIHAKHAHLVLMGYGPMANEVKSSSIITTNIHYLPAVPPGQVHHYTRGADIGIAFIEPVSLSYEYCLPNKLFEYLHAGLGVLASNLPEMRLVIEQLRCGQLIAPDCQPEEMAKIIRNISWTEVKQWQACSEQESQRFSWEAQEASIISSYRHLLDQVML